MSEIRGIFGGYWHGEDVVALVIHPDPTSYDPETALEPPFPFGSTVVLRAAPSPVTEPGTFERRWKSLAVWAAQETVGGARAMGERVLERMVAIERGDPDTLVPASWAAPSPVKAAGEGPTKAEIGLVAAALVSAHNASDAVLLAGYAERARMLLVALAAIRAPAPTSAVPGLREAVAECRSRFAAIRDSADKARKREAKARHIGAVVALDHVLDEIDRRTPAPSDGEGR